MPFVPCMPRVLDVLHTTPLQWLPASSFCTANTLQCTAPPPLRIPIRCSCVSFVYSYLLYLPATTPRTYGFTPSYHCWFWFYDSPYRSPQFCCLIIAPAALGPYRFYCRSPATVGWTPAIPRVLPFVVRLPVYFPPDG